MKRREFIGLVGGATLSLPLLSTAHAQSRIYQIGRFIFGPVTSADDAWLEGMRALGYREGDNMVVHRVSADGRPELIAEKAANLVRMKLDVIVTTGNQLPMALRKASRTVPIVVAGTSDGVVAGLWDSHPRPGGNVTGIDNRSSDLDIKHVEIAKEIFPKLEKLAVLYTENTLNWAARHESLKLAAEKIGANLLPVAATRVDDFRSAFTRIADYKPDALIVIDSPLFVSYASEIGDLLVKHSIASIHRFSLWMSFGALVSYGASVSSTFRRSAYFVDRILKGARPADLPVELPDVYELAVNLKRAKELGITMPYTLVSRADTVIE